MNRLIGGTGIFAACFLCWGIRSCALEQDVILKPEDDKVKVSIGGAEDTVISMRLSLEVEVTEGNADVSFEFDPGVESTVKQYRYEKETGILNLYVSGNTKQKIFQTEEFCLGRVVLDPGTGESAVAAVRVTEDSLETVNDAYDRQRVRVNASPEQKISVGMKEDDPEPDADRTEDPSVLEPEEGGSGNGESSEKGEGSDAGNTGQAAEPVKRRQSLEDRHPERQDVGIRSGTMLQTADADAETDPDTEQGVLEEEPGAEGQRTEEPEAEQTPEPEKIQASEPKSGPDVLLLAGMTAGMAAAVFVIYLMVLEWRKIRKKKETEAKKADRPAKGKRPKSGKK